MDVEKPKSKIPNWVDFINILFALGCISFLFSDYDPDEVNVIPWILGTISIMRAGYFIATDFK